MVALGDLRERVAVELIGGDRRDAHLRHRPQRRGARPALERGAHAEDRAGSVLRERLTVQALQHAGVEHLLETLELGLDGAPRLLEVGDSQLLKKLGPEGRMQDVSPGYMKLRGLPVGERRPQPKRPPKWPRAHFGERALAPVLADVYIAKGSSNTLLVGATGIEPVTARV